MKTFLNDPLAQSDHDFAGFKPRNANLGEYAGVGVVWNPTTNKFDVGGGGAGSVMLNVKDAPYNAAGDGVTDDTAAVQGAMNDAVFTYGGGKVFFPRGIYQCDGTLLDYFNCVLMLPWINASTTPTAYLELIGETYPLWSVASAHDETRNACIRTNTSGAGAALPYPALLGGDQPHAPGVIPYANMNNLFLKVSNLNFIVQDAAMNAVRVNGIGWSIFEQVGCYGAYGGGTEDTCGLWLPASQNFSINVANLINANGFATGIRTGEHLRAPKAIQVSGCKVGVEFTDGIYPSQAYIQIINVADALKWTGQHPVDVLLETEHAPGGAPAWMLAAHEIKDPNNYGTGIVKYFIGQGGRPNPAIGAAVEGGAHLALTNLAAGLGT